MQEQSARIHLLDLQRKRERREPRRQAARALGVHPQHLFNVEKGRIGPSLVLVLRCVQRYGPLHLISRDDGTVFRIQEVDASTPPADLIR